MSCMGETIVIDAAGSTTPFPHFWEHMFGSCHASVTLCEDWRNDLRMLKEIVDVKYVRFHGIFERSVGIYDREDKDGSLILNFTRVDLIYDGLLKNGVRPFVELGFMPEELAKTQTVHPFWYHPIVAPPRDSQKWYQLIFLFAQHLVDRYGLAEVTDWYFEVWNEPNINFWAGEPQEETYYDLYDLTARALKAVSPLLRVVSSDIVTKTTCQLISSRRISIQTTRRSMSLGKRKRSRNRRWSLERFERSTMK